MKFEPLASGSAANAYICRDAGGSVLGIEAGLPWKRFQAAHGYQVTELAGLLLSHSHGDHACSAAKVMDASVDVYASAETLAVLDLAGHHRARVLQPVPLDPKGTPGRHVDIHPYRHPTLRGYDRGPKRTEETAWRVLAFEVVHDCPGTVGFLVGAPDGDLLVFATDTAYLPVRADGCTHVAIEVSYSEATLAASERPDEHVSRLIRSHMSLEAAVAMLLANDLGRCRQITLLHLSGDHGDAEVFARTIEGRTGIPVVVAPKDRPSPF